MATAGSPVTVWEAAKQAWDGPLPSAIIAQGFLPGFVILRRLQQENQQLVSPEKDDSLHSDVRCALNKTANGMKKKTDCSTLLMNNSVSV